MNNNIKDNENKIKTLPWLGIPKLLPYVRPYKKIIVQMVTLDRKSVV